MLNRLFGLIIISALFCNELLAVNLYPEYIKVGQVSKEQRRSYYVKIYNDSTDDIELLGVINQCGLNMEIPKKKISPQKAIEAELNLYSGTVPGRFIEEVKILYKSNNIISQKILKVNWFNKPERFSKIIIPTNKIFLGNVEINRYATAFIEILNAGNSRGEILIDKGNYNLIIPETNVNINENEMVIIPVKFMPSESEDNITLFVDIKDLFSDRKRIDISFRKIDGLTVSLGEKSERDGHIYIPLTLEVGQGWGQLLSVSDINGRSIEYDTSVIKRGKKNLINLKVPKSIINELNSLIFKVHFQAIND